MESMPHGGLPAGHDREPAATTIRALLKQTWSRSLLWTGAGLIGIVVALARQWSVGGQFEIVVTALRFGIGIIILFFVVLAAGAVIAALLPPLRKLRPFLWRIWLWGTLGLVCGFLLPDGILVAVLMIIAVTTGGNPFDTVGAFAMALYLLPPAGAIMGGLLGIAFGHSSARHSIYCGSPRAVLAEAHEA